MTHPARSREAVAADLERMANYPAQDDKRLLREAAALLRTPRDEDQERPNDLARGPGPEISAGPRTASQPEVTRTGSGS